MDVRWGRSSFTLLLLLFASIIELSIARRDCRSLPEPSSNLAGVAVGGRTVVFAGGLNVDNTCNNFVVSFDSSAPCGALLSAPPLSLARESMGLVLIDDLVFFAGGNVKANAATNMTDVVDVYSFSNVRGQRIDVNITIPHPVSYPNFQGNLASLSFPRQKTGIVYGGMFVSGAFSSETTWISIGDLMSNNFSVSKGLNGTTTAFGQGYVAYTTAVIDESVVAFYAGGYNTGNIFSSIIVANLTDSTFNIYDDALPVAVFAAAACSIGRQVYIAGGNQGGLHSNVIYTFSYDNKTVVSVGKLAAARAYHSCGVLGPYVYFAGGTMSNGTLLASVEVFDSRDNSVFDAPAFEIGTAFFASVSTRDAVYFAGGVNSTTAIYNFTCGNSVVDLEEACDLSKHCSQNCSMCLSPSIPCSGGYCAVGSCCGQKPTLSVVDFTCTSGIWSSIGSVSSSSVLVSIESSVSIAGSLQVTALPLTIAPSVAVAVSGDLVVSNALTLTPGSTLAVAGNVSMSAGSMLIVEASSSSSAVTISKCVAVNGGLNITLSKEKEAQLLADKYLNVSVLKYSCMTGNFSDFTFTNAAVDPCSEQSVERLYNQTDLVVQFRIISSGSCGEVSWILVVSIVVPIAVVVIIVLAVIFGVSSIRRRVMPYRDRESFRPRKG